MALRFLQLQRGFTDADLDDAVRAALTGLIQAVAPPLPAALDCRGTGDLVRSTRPRRPAARLCLFRGRAGRLQHDGEEPKTLCNVCDGAEPEVEGGGGITTAPAEQGSPVIEFLPIVGASIAVLSAGETGTGGGWATVFPLRIGLVVFPLRIGLLVFCASAIAVVAVRMRTLRPISWLRFAVMV
jgi:hypothetical protein